jgi:UDP-2,4-diacetamido-2,4,6-trideoxy-beta-L-altropyranose hydrolase
LGWPINLPTGNPWIDLMSLIKRVVIRVDASVEMGMGHLMRCMSLANVLAEEGTEVFFLLRSHAAALTGLIEADGHAVRLLADPPHDSGDAPGAAPTRWLPTTWQRDAGQTLDAIGQMGAPDWLIVDHYGLDARWERLQRQQVQRILAIDDLADRPHDCDILLDQNFVQDPETRYQGHVPGASQQLLGPRYALLRREFAEQRKSLTGRNGEVRRILVCYGGSDPSNETAKALVAIKGLSHESLAVDVVVGRSNPNAELISALCLELPCAQLHRDVRNMADLLRGADLALGAGGGMSWERCCLGLPTIAVDIADNQIGALTGLAKIGALVYLGSAASVTEEETIGAIQSLLNDPARTRQIGEIAQKLVDGQGSHRVLAAMKMASGPQAHLSR